MCRFTDEFIEDEAWLKEGGHQGHSLTAVSYPQISLIAFSYLTLLPGPMN